MLEGAKLIGAGAATIASAGAAVGSGNGFSSLIHSAARNPSLTKQQKSCLCDFGLCSNRSYCIVCPNDGLFDLIRLHKKVSSTSRLGSRGRPLFYRGIRPAINVGLSVSRAGDRSFFSTSGSSADKKRAEFMRSFYDILVLSASAAARFKPPVLFTPDDLIEVAKRIHSFSYSFCPFVLKETESNPSNVLLAHPDMPNITLSFHIVNKLDALLIQALASSLNAHFLKRQLFAPNSFLAFGEIVEVEAFSQHLEKWGGLESVVLFNFAIQIQRIKKDELLAQISPLLEECPEILFLLRAFLDQPILNEKGETFNEPMPTPIFIPPMAQVLLNFHLCKVDEALVNVDVKMARIGKEVVIGIPKGSGKSAKDIIEKVDSLEMIYRVKTIGEGETFACADGFLNVGLERGGKLYVAQTVSSAAS